MVMRMTPFESAEKVISRCACFLSDFQSSSRLFRKLLWIPILTIWTTKWAILGTQPITTLDAPFYWAQKVMSISAIIFSAYPPIVSSDGNNFPCICLSEELTDLENQWNRALMDIICKGRKGYVEICYYFTRLFRGPSALLDRKLYFAAGSGLQFVKLNWSPTRTLQTLARLWHY